MILTEPLWHTRHHLCLRCKFNFFKYTNYIYIPFMSIIYYVSISIILRLYKPHLLGCSFAIAKSSALLSHPVPVEYWNREGMIRQLIAAAPSASPGPAPKPIAWPFLCSWATDQTPTHYLHCPTKAEEHSSLSQLLIVSRLAMQPSHLNSINSWL